MSENDKLTLPASEVQYDCERKFAHRERKYQENPASVLSKVQTKENAEKVSRLKIKKK
jgi:hypothetical protein